MLPITSRTLSSSVGAKGIEPNWPLCDTGFTVPPGPRPVCAPKNEKSRLGISPGGSSSWLFRLCLGEEPPGVQGLARRDGVRVQAHGTALGLAHVFDEPKPLGPDFRIRGCKQARHGFECRLRGRESNSRGPAYEAGLRGPEDPANTLPALWMLLLIEKPVKRNATRPLRRLPLLLVVFALLALPADLLQGFLAALRRHS
jgi:hypothetical protein